MSVGNAGAHRQSQWGDLEKRSRTVSRETLLESFGVARFAALEDLLVWHRGFARDRGGRQGNPSWSLLLEPASLVRQHQRVDNGKGWSEVDDAPLHQIELALEDLTARKNLDAHLVAHPWGDQTINGIVMLLHGGVVRMVALRAVRCQQLRCVHKTGALEVGRNTLCVATTVDNGDTRALWGEGAERKTTEPAVG